MKNERMEKLRKITIELESLIEDPTAECIMAPGNGYDESMLIGTTDSFLRLARTLIEIARVATNESEWATADLDRDTLCGQTVVTTNTIKQAFNELAPIWPVAAYIATSNVDVTRILERLTKRAPE